MLLLLVIIENWNYLLENGKLYTWGQNGCYECGLGHGDDVFIVK